MDFQTLQSAQPLFSHYSSGSLMLGGVLYSHSISIFPDEAAEELIVTEGTTQFEWIKNKCSTIHESKPEVVLVGTGKQMSFPTVAQREWLYENGLIHLEWMDTAAACRTYNLLCGEGRRVAGLFWLDTLK
ncbi:MAG: Mth938-like domain-containing protein [Pseudomonadota bacterium]